MWKVDCTFHFNLKLIENVLHCHFLYQKDDPIKILEYIIWNKSISKIGNGNDVIGTTI